ncbi:hypothetical protein J3Q64DRAFT_1637851 [Phycomyces blakesleeanus]|uniref:Endonuclease/exonuclease/phosphatase domain-containing protein n=1 Tax=Phycomyces blakesleeanus TaxID=4837 RepID=A0ABR3B2L8_PHYBL
MATINCQGLTKASDSQQHNHLIRHLQSQNIQILALQETHAKNNQIQHIFNNQFQAYEN